MRLHDINLVGRGTRDGHGRGAGPAGRAAARACGGEGVAERVAGDCLKQKRLSQPGGQGTRAEPSST
jgi:hypothetical protein